MGTPQPEPNEYPNVKNAHIVPRTYLQNFATDGKIGVRLVREGGSLVQPITSVGTRRRFYRRERPDGRPIDDIEWSLGHGEAAATPVLRSFQDEWPLATDDKLKLAELFAYQLLRGPRWKDEHAERTRGIIADLRDEGKLTWEGGERELSAEELDKAEEVFLTDTSRFIRMLATGPTITSILGSMHWTLVDFAAPVVATSDHPVVLWPGVAARSPQPTQLGVGLLECGEIRLPLSPTRAVLMTWSDTPDDEETVVPGRRHHASNLNAFTVASADRQWFHLPGTSPPVGTGRFLPLSLELVRGYTGPAAASSKRRARVSAEVQPKAGRKLDDREVSVVTMSRTRR